MNPFTSIETLVFVSAGCHINDVMNVGQEPVVGQQVSAGCHINDVMNWDGGCNIKSVVSAGCHINDVMNNLPVLNAH